MSPFSLFLSGAICLASLVVALFFLRFWRSSRDVFFLLFALSFALEGASRTAAVFLLVSDNNPMFYATRVVAYGLIIIAIWQKNRR